MFVAQGRQSRGQQGKVSRPHLEILEERCLLAPGAGLPDIAMLSATAANASSVTFSYEIRNADVSQPFQVGIYRSADAHFDPADIALGAQTISGEGTRQGPHNLTVTLPGGLPPDPAHPFVLAVADPAGAVAESDRTDNVAALRKYLIGVVTHGLQLDGTFPGWVPEMAASLRADGYDAVIPFDWAALSNVPAPGLTELAGQVLASQVAALAQQFPGPVDAHFIGHSRGAVVVSQALEDLQQLDLPQLNQGYLKMTLLDPHPASNTGVPQFSPGPGPLGQEAAAFTVAFQAAAQDPDVVVPANVADAEVYYQHSDALQVPPGLDQLVNLWGEVPIRGVSHYCALTGLGHLDVPDWYEQNVVPLLATATPFVCPPGLLMDLPLGEERWLDRAYLRLLGRPADPDALVNAGALLESGASPVSVVLAIEGGLEYQAGLVQRLYQTLLGRPAGPVELSAGVLFLRQGGTDEGVETLLLGSPEYFQGRAGGTAGGFLQALYHDVLGRPPDAVAAEVLGNLLEQGTPLYLVAAQVLTSPEAAQDRVEADYQQFLDRPADPAGLSTFTSALEAGIPDEVVTAILLGSTESLDEA